MFDQAPPRAPHSLRLNMVHVSVDHDVFEQQVVDGLVTFISPHLTAAKDAKDMLGVWQLALVAMQHNQIPGF